MLNLCLFASGAHSPSAFHPVAPLSLTISLRFWKIFVDFCLLTVIHPSQLHVTPFFWFVFNLSSSAQELQPSLPFTGKGFAPLTSIFLFGILQGLELRDGSWYARKCTPLHPHIRISSSNSYRCSFLAQCLKGWTWTSAFLIGSLENS